ncbi:MAG: GNAT family N-acetyltransferase, partial [Bacteroidota bacterium]
LKDPKQPGFQAKQQWFEQRYREGLRLKILRDENQRPLGFIEYVPAAQAWRPLQAPGYLFIHCLMVYAGADKGQGHGSHLIEVCRNEAVRQQLAGVVTMTSKGSWMASKQLFLKLGFHEVAEQDRFQLLAWKRDPQAKDPHLLDWRAQQSRFQGWHLVVAHQCPWHAKAIAALRKTAGEHGIDLEVHVLESSAAARQAPSGFGVFSLLHQGRLLADHYISATRFRNIIRAEQTRES